MPVISDPAFLIPAAFVAVALCIVWFIMAGRTDRKEAVARFEQLKREANSLLAYFVERGKIPPKPVSIILRDGEEGLYQEPGTLYESHSYRVHVGGGTSIEGVLVVGGVSQSQQAIQEIDSGVLILTTHRLVFDGGAQNRTIELKHLLSARALADAVEISSSKLQKSQLYAVANPFLWAGLITLVAQQEAAPTKKKA